MSVCYAKKEQCTDQVFIDFTQKKTRFICDPALVCPEAVHVTSSVLYPKEYRWTKPDALLSTHKAKVKPPKLVDVVNKLLKFDIQKYNKLELDSDVNLSTDSDSSLSDYSDTEFSDSEHSDTDAELESPLKEDLEGSDTEIYFTSGYDSDEKMDIKKDVKPRFKSTLTLQMKSLLNTNVTDMLQDESLKRELEEYKSYSDEHVSRKHLKLVHSVSQLRKSPREERLHSLNQQLASHKNMKKQVVNNMSFLLDTISRLKSEYMYHASVAVEIEDEIHARETMQAISTAKNLPRKVSMQLSKIKSELPAVDEPLDCMDSKKTQLQQDIDTMPSCSDANAIKQESPTVPDFPVLQPTRRKHVCAVCSKEYTDKRSFVDHVEGHTSKTPIHKCSRCPDRLFRSTQSFNNHKSFHKNGDVYSVCTICKNKFELESRLKAHMGVHSEPSLPCRVHSKEDCGRLFTFQRERKNHEAYHGLPKHFQCDTCEKLFTLPKTLHTHQQKFAHVGMTKLW